MDTFHPRILIVDDEPAILRTLSSFLRGEGYDCATEDDPLAALTRLHNEAFHIVITDLVMPKLDGLEFVRRLREEEVTAEVIVMTAHTSLERAVEAYGRGVSDYLLKPFDSLQDVLRVVREAEGRLRRWRSIMLQSMGQAGQRGSEDLAGAATEGPVRHRAPGDEGGAAGADREGEPGAVTAVRRRRPD